MSKIMLVDDNERILKFVGRVLEDGGHDVTIADCGEMCLEILKDEKPDLILMDVMMPDMDGWETIDKIKDDESNKDILISTLTVKSRDVDKNKSLEEAGADWHISKPVKNDELLETVNWLLTKPDLG